MKLLIPKYSVNLKCKIYECFTQLLDGLCLSLYKL